MSRSRDDDEKLAQSARRSASNEATLIWGLLGAFLSVIFFPLWWKFGLEYMSIQIVVVFAFSISGIIALVWFFNARERIKLFQKENNDRMKAKKAEIREAHLATLKQRMADQGNAGKKKIEP